MKSFDDSKEDTKELLNTVLPGEDLQDKQEKLMVFLETLQQ